MLIDTDTPALRAYQTAALRETLARIHERPVLVLPTGAGKTVLAAALVSEVGRRCLWVAHRRELIHQAANALSRVGLHVGVIMAGQGEDRSAPVQVASVQTLARREMPTVGMVIIDEAHHARATTYRKIVDRYAGTPIVGLTATPFRLDGKGLGDVFGSIVVGAYCDDLVREGWLVDPVVYAPAAPDLRGVHTVGGDYREDELERAMARPRLVGDVVDTWARLAGGRRTVCFAVSIAHSEMIVAAFRKAGVPAEHLDGSTPRTLRDATLMRLRSGYTKLVSNCMVLTEGWDLPALEVAIVARPTASLNLHLQMLGRIMRAADGKAGSVVLDHAGNYGRHGLVTQRLTYSLEDRVRPDRPGEAPTKTCPECSMVVPAGTYECPGCGHQWARPPMPEHAAGDLEQVHGGDLKRPPLETQQAAWESIEARRVALGYREGWSQHVFRARFGFHPVVMQNRVIDQEAATPDDHVLVLRTFQDRAKQHGYKPGWAAHRYKEVFGRWPDPETKEAAQ